jgi:16S rRNA (guanine966-N2)-methyltransferase
MRIIAGHLGGRQFASPRGHRTHPMSDKVRGALFNTLGDIEGLGVLDAFAGSGALGYEAVSRGAAQALAIENDQSAQQAIAANIILLGLPSQLKLITASANAWLSTTNEEFDIVLCDPPYDDPQLKLLERLAGRAKPTGLVVFSLPPTVRLSLPADKYELLAAKDYGDARLSFYRRLA